MHTHVEKKKKNGFGKDITVLFGLLFIGGAVVVSAADQMNGYNIAEDSDHDGLTNAEEKIYGTEPNKSDTDGDGYSDGVEVRGGYNPLKRLLATRSCQPLIRLSWMRLSVEKVLTI